MFCVLFVLILAMIVGPAVAGDKLPVSSITDSLSGVGFKLVQPNKQDNDDTRGDTDTGTGRPNYSGAYTFTSYGDDKETGTAD